MAGISNANGSLTGSNQLSGSVALVTGASRGIGRAIAHRLATLGARVFSQVTDVTHAEQVSEFVSKTEGALGPINILVNNAGIGLFGPAHEKSEADWDRVLNSNLKSVFLVSRAVIPSMIRRGSGDIINISSLAGKNTFAGGGIYCASKWGLMGLSGSKPKDPSKALSPEDVAHAVEALVTQRPGSFLSEIHLRPLRK